MSTCEPVIAAAFADAREKQKAYDRTAEDKQHSEWYLSTMSAVMIRACITDAWSAEVVACVGAAAKTEIRVDYWVAGCALTPQQAARLQAAIRDSSDVATYGSVAAAKNARYNCVYDEAAEQACTARGSGFEYGYPESILYCAGDPPLKTSAVDAAERRIRSTACPCKDVNAINAEHERVCNERLAKLSPRRRQAVLDGLYGCRYDDAAFHACARRGPAFRYGAPTNVWCSGIPPSKGELARERQARLTSPCACNDLKADEAKRERCANIP